ncbi:MAG TPA: FkbM family methyltransferase [Verrucomicrobiae bacterium]|jgi:FkbM family methyltransferase|nr:FkbM family methyltransferase [Verrucomicrobiae bacterium]
MTTSLDLIASDPGFKTTKLFRELQKNPFGFIDVGALGGIHPIVDPIAGLTHALCFEPDEKDCEALRNKYAEASSFARVTVEQTALGAPGKEKENLYISKVATNTSLLKPNPHFISRYQAKKFEVDRVLPIQTRTLDSVLAGGKDLGGRMGEMLKLDTQGSEYRILKGAEKLLDKTCLAVWCEVEFFEVYEGQETFSDIDRLLREHGFLIYGIYPHYRSTKSLDRSQYTTEERLMWADAVFIKDPLDSRNQGRKFSERDLQSLVLIAMLTRFYDFALELVRGPYPEPADRKALENLILTLAKVDNYGLRDDIERLNKACSKNPDRTNVLVGLFVSRHQSNNTVDHLLDRVR